MLFAKVVTVEAGWDSEEEEAKRLFKVGEVYEVMDVSIGGSCTYVKLKGFIGGIEFNSVFFEFYEDEECTIEKDIFADEDLNPYL